MGNFSQKVDKFLEIFIEQNGYEKVLEGLKNTLIIAIAGLIIGIIDGYFDCHRPGCAEV